MHHAIPYASLSSGDPGIVSGSVNITSTTYVTRVRNIKNICLYTWFFW